MAGVDDALLCATDCRFFDGRSERANRAFDLERLKYHVKLCQNAAAFYPDAVMPVGPQAQQALKATPLNGAPTPAGILGPVPSLGGPLPASLTSTGGTASIQTTPLVENALNVEFKNSEKMPLATMLDLVATRLGINWEFLPSKGVIRFYRLVTKTWQLPIQPGTNSFTTEFKQTSQGSGGTGNSGSSNSSQIDAAAKAELKELDDLEEVRKSLNPVRTMVGDLDLNRGTGLLTMRDTREAVEAADDIIRRQIAIYSRMVTLKFQMIDLSVADNGEAGVDWNAVLTKALENVPGFTLSALSPSTLVSSTAGSFGLTMNSGQFAGTNAIMSALKQYGTVTSSVTIPVSMRIWWTHRSSVWRRACCWIRCRTSSRRGRAARTTRSRGPCRSRPVSAPASTGRASYAAGPPPRVSTAI